MSHVSKVFRIELKQGKGGSSKVWVRIFANRQTPFPEIKVKIGPRYKKIESDDLLKKIKTRKDKVLFQRHYNLLESKWLAILGGEHSIVKIVGTEDGLVRLTGRIDPSNWAREGVTFEFYDEKKNDWKSLGKMKDNTIEDNLTRLKAQDQVRLKVRVIGDTIARKLEKMIPYFYFLDLSPKDKYVIERTSGNCRLHYRSMDSGIYREIKDLPRFISEQPPTVGKKIEQALKWCVQDPNLNRSKTINMTAPPGVAWWNENEDIKYRTRGMAGSQMEHPYICPNSDNPKACYFDEKHKRCVEPPKNLSCRRVRNLAQNRTRNLHLLYSPEIIGQKNPCSIFAAAARIGGSSINFNNTLLAEVEAEYRKRHNELSILMTSDLKNLWDVVDHVFFDNSLTSFFKTKLPRFVIHRDAKFETFEHFAMYAPAENELHLNIAGINQRWLEIQQTKHEEGTPYVNQNGVGTHSRQRMIIKIFLHELAHYLEFQLPCQNFLGLEHNVDWLMLHKYFFGGGDSIYISGGVQIQVD